MDRFQYNLNDTNTISDEANIEEREFSGVLEIYAHNARNIHNICIYENQDVYAKFSLTYDPDETVSTRIVKGGGKNPDFHESLRMKVTQLDSVLKCEIWMLSRVRNYMEDQLLGFALVPVSQLAGRQKLTQDYSLSSTDLFHSPAGTVQLTLSLNTSLPLSPSLNPLSESPGGSSITSEVVLLDPVEYSRIEFPDISVVRENQQMVSEYFDSGSCSGGPGGIASFLHLGACPDYEMAANNSSEETHGGRSNSGFFSSSTATSLSDDRNSADSNEKSRHVDGGESSTVVEARDEKEDNESNDGEDDKNKQAFSGPLDMEAEQSAMQQQIVDMYMRSMQQFTESLAKMKLPMELDKPEARQDQSASDMVRSHGNNTNNKLEVDKKKDGSRVFYGSRAFF